MLSTSSPPTSSHFWNPFRPKPQRHSAHVEGVLGTALELHLRTARASQARIAQEAALAEIDRLEHIYSRFDPASELNRWQRGEQGRISSDLLWLLREGLDWLERTGGAFHPGADLLSVVWRAAEARGEPPTQADLAPVLERLSTAPYVLEPSGVARARPEVTLNFNALAKGRIADEAARAALACDGVLEVVVNIGGDLRHLGAGQTRVSIADPFARSDNAAPFARVRVSNGAVATSGSAFRGFDIGGERFSHVLDPRTGQPSKHLVSVSVLAPECATADALATALSVLEPREGLELVEGLPNVGCLLVARDGAVYASARWKEAAGG